MKAPFFLCTNVISTEFLKERESSRKSDESWDQTCAFLLPRDGEWCGWGSFLFTEIKTPKDLASYPGRWRAVVSQDSDLWNDFWHLFSCLIEASSHGGVTRHEMPVLHISHALQLPRQHLIMLCEKVLYYKANHSLTDPLKAYRIRILKYSSLCRHKSSNNSKV